MDFGMAATMLVTARDQAINEVAIVRVDPQI
jgi:hypothetical protein